MDKQQFTSTTQERRKTLEAALTPEEQHALEVEVVNIAVDMYEDIYALQRKNWCESCQPSTREGWEQAMAEGKDPNGWPYCSSCSAKQNLIEDLFRGHGIDVDHWADDNSDEDEAVP